MPLFEASSTVIAISQRKSNFLKSISDDTFKEKSQLRQLCVRDLSLMASYYAKKYGIRIYVEGLLPLDMPTHPDLTDGKISWAYDEMKSIQQSLKENEYAGYIYTDLNYSVYSKQIDEGNRRHCEVFIISKTSVIQPVCWNIRSSIPVPKFAGSSSSSTDLNQFFGFLKRAQSSLYECGSLGLGAVDN